MTIPALLRILAIFALAAPAVARAAQCGDAGWAEPPKMEDGRFHGTVALECRISIPENSGLVPLREQLEGAIRRERKILSGPAELAGNDGLQAKRYETYRQDRDGDDALSLLETVELGTGPDARLVYRTRSSEVRGEGLASYLKRLAFSAEIRRSETRGLYRVVLRNSVEVARPWYAPSPIFFPIAKGKTLGKAEKKMAEFAVALEIAAKSAARSAGPARAVAKEGP